MFNPAIRNEAIQWPTYAISLSEDCIPEDMTAQAYAALLEMGNEAVLKIMLQCGFQSPTGSPETWADCEMAEFAIQSTEYFPQMWSVLFNACKIDKL